MHRIAPFALLAALLATAGSGLAALEAIGEVAAFAELTAGETTDYASQLAEDAQEPSVLFYVVVSNAIFLKNSGEATALAAANAIVAAPSDPWTFARSWSDNAYAAAWMKADMAEAVAGNAYETAYAVVDVEAGAFAGAPEAALACAGSARPLSCAEEFVHTLVEA